MKKKIFKVLAATLFVGGLVFNLSMSNSDNSNSELLGLDVTAKTSVANAENPDCPNGCVIGTSGCYCYTWYYYKEYGSK